jgi:membrane-associated phospholipid phosphatase
MSSSVQFDDRRAALGTLAQFDAHGGAISMRLTRRALWIAAVLLLSSFAVIPIDGWLATWPVHDCVPAAFRKLCLLSEPFGHGIGVLVIGLLVFQLDVGRRWCTPRLLLISLGSGVLADIVKLFIARVRPRHIDALAAHASGFSGFMPFLGNGHVTQSFPSGHAAVAVGLAIGLTWLYPRGRWTFAVLAALASLQRLGEGAHYMSDLLFAAGIAYLVAAVCLHWPPVAMRFQDREMHWRAADRPR